MNNISNIEKGKLNLFEHFWTNSKDNMFLATLDKDGDFIAEEMNPSQMENLGQNEKIINKKLKDFLGEENACFLEKKYLKCLEENTPIMEEESVQVDGEERYYNTMIIPINDEKSGEKKIIGISREITELKLAKQNLEKLNKELDLLINQKDEELFNANEKLKALAFEDSLTGIGNRRYLNDHANKAISLAHRYDSCLTLMVLDIDGLTQVNETCSHTFGDSILKEFANLLKDSIRDSDILARYSGEEFLLLLPMTSLAAAQTLGKRLLEQTRELKFEFKEQKIAITTSIGAAALESPQDNLDSLLHKTYDALSVAKKEGKNKLVSFIDKNSYKIDT
ncbi:sensor domain-containing diguanylate cyclase [Halarcobacter bivalviorum]|uniref:diguanylate cyclase n=1 Tax=Halarcobacter bivalviorum TaxID=663364 RepID=A0AAX2A4A1_9BACT|nr:sensor domain-containing diguanylate cyclase [Halarcobacter bivalviorum]AXH12878.1 PAS sensor-containing diguanylate cyclase [Halarcobacter bivalviorum]RXK08997.1 hypothetical protein CRV05_12015 [Halarcobacter bivalviorum]